MNRLKEVISLIDCMDRMPWYKKGDDWTIEYGRLLNELHYLKSVVKN